MELQVGHIIDGRFRVLSMDAGGMGKIYVCQSIHGEEKYVLKTPLDHLLENEDVVSRFMREARIWVSLGDIPYVITAHDVEMIDGRPFVIAEYGGSWNLRRWLDRRAVPLDQGIDIAIDICKGMGNARALVPSIIHGDLTPDNVVLSVWHGVALGADWLVENQGEIQKIVAESAGEREQVERLSRLTGKEIEEKIRRVNITDFGLAKATGVEWQGRSRTAATRGASGKLAYLAPEQCAGNPVQQASDVYSFGIMLYELLTGHWPYEGETGSSVLECHTNAKPADPHAYDRSVPDQIRRLVLRCLAKDPRDRPQDFPAMATELSVARVEMSGAQEAFKSKLREAVQCDLDLNIPESLRAGEIVHNVSLSKPFVDIRDGWQRANVLFKRALTEMSLGRVLKGVGLLDQALEQGTDDIRAILACAERLFDMGGFALALKYADRALGIDGTSQDAKLIKANALCCNGRPEVAIEVYNELLDQEPDSAEVLTNIGSTYCDYLNDPKRALGYFNRALVIEAGFVPALIGKGVASGNCGDLGCAMDCFEKVLECDPMNSKALLLKGGLLCDRHGRYAEALGIFEGLIASNPNHAQAWYNGGVALRGLGRVEKAIASFERAFSLDANQTDALFNIGGILAERGLFDRALPYLEKLLMRKPHDVQAAALRQFCAMHAQPDG